MGEVTWEDHSFAVGELCDVIEHLLSYSRSGTLHEDEGENEAATRARDALRRYREWLAVPEVAPESTGLAASVVFPYVLTDEQITAFERWVNDYYHLSS